jgi:hypothetical protein
MIADGSTRRPLAVNLLMSHAEVAEERGGFDYVEPINDPFNSRLQLLLSGIDQLAKDIAVVSNRFGCVPQRPRRETLATWGLALATNMLVLIGR